MADLPNTPEIWKIIPYATDYAVSTNGRVMRVVGRERARAGRLIKTSLAGPRRNYVYVGFVHNDGIRRTKGMHAVMLETFVSPKPEGCEGAHLDGDSLNNVLSNLQWKTPKENAADRGKHGTQTRGVKYGLGKLNDDRVRQIRSSNGITEAKLAATFGVSQSMINRIRQGKAWRHVD